MHVDLGGYHVRDIEFVAAFDIDAEKVGKDLSEAIWSGQNDTIKFADVPELGVKVHRGMTHDGLGKYLKQRIKKAPGPTDDVVGILRDTRADVLVCYLPVGSEQATKWYVEQALSGGRRVRQLPTGVHRPRGLLGTAASALGRRVPGQDVAFEVDSENGVVPGILDQEAEEFGLPRGLFWYWHDHGRRPLDNAVSAGRLAGRATVLKSEQLSCPGQLRRED